MDYEKIKELSFDFLKIPYKNVEKNESEQGTLASLNAEFDLKKQIIDGEKVLYLLKDVNNYYEEKIKEITKNYETKIGEMEVSHDLDIAKYNAVSKELEKKLNDIREPLNGLLTNLKIRELEKFLGE